MLPFDINCCPHWPLYFLINLYSFQYSDLFHVFHGDEVCFTPFWILTLFQWSLSPYKIFLAVVHYLYKGFHFITTFCHFNSLPIRLTDSLSYIYIYAFPASKNKILLDSSLIILHFKIANRKHRVFFFFFFCSFPRQEVRLFSNIWALCYERIFQISGWLLTECKSELPGFSIIKSDSFTTRCQDSSAHKCSLVPFTHSAIFK